MRHLLLSRARLNRLPFSQWRRSKLRWLGLLMFCSGYLLSESFLPVGFADAKPMPYPTFKTANGFSRLMQNVSGFTPLSGWMANRLLHRELQKLISGPVESRLSLYSGTDMLHGKVRRIHIRGTQVIVNELLPLQEFQLETLDDSPVFVSNDHRPILLKPLDLLLTARLREADVNTLLNSPQGQKRLNNLEVMIPPFGKQALDIVNPKVRFEAGRVTLIALVNKHAQPLENALPVQVSGELSSENSRLNLRNIDLQITGFEPEEVQELAQFIENYFGEVLNLNHIKVDRHTLKVQMEQSEITAGQLQLKAKIHMEPQRKYLEKYWTTHGKKANPPKN